MTKGGQSKGAPAMREAWRLAEAGDVKRARKAAQAVLTGATAATPTGTPEEKAEEKAEAEDLLHRTAFPREALKIAAVAATLIAVLLVIAALRG